MDNSFYINSLISETSPYLLQHAHNPVNWYPWGKAALEKAVHEDKPLIISIGYSSCHWCHVMESESFMDEEVARLMNDHFVCIKVDREERPDIDQVYMDAVHLMNRQGGWPLNVFALPGGKPFFGGTYFTKTQWIGLCNEIISMYRIQRNELVTYAEKLSEGVSSMNLFETEAGNDKIETSVISEIFDNLYKDLDTKNGGLNAGNKFPMPDVFSFLLRYHALTGNTKAMEQVRLTLEKMATGGIFDQLGGGFARYSTDVYWKVPHFEKMLYDNAQLIGLYSEAWQHTHNPLFKEIVYHTFEFVASEFTSPEGGFYSSLDADSEGEEGKYYLWTENEIKETCGANSSISMDYFGIGNEGLLEDDKNILVVADTFPSLMKKYNLRQEELENILSEMKFKMSAYRDKRIKPTLDDKCLTCWNSMMTDNLLTAYRVFQDTAFLGAAEKNILFIQKYLYKEGKLFRNFRQGKTSVPAYLDDYSLLIKALISFYEVKFNFDYLAEAGRLIGHVTEHFYDIQTGYFHFTDKNADKLFSHKIETADNVIPSSNSVMAINLFLLGKLMTQKEYLGMSRTMLEGMMENVIRYPSYYANWAKLLLYFKLPFFEIAITGKDAIHKRMELESVLLPNKVVVGSDIENQSLPLLKDRFVKDKTLFYVCTNNTCSLPVEEPEKVISMIKESMNLRY